MTADELKAEFLEYAMDNDRGQGQAMVDWSYWVVNVVIPRVTTEAAQKGFNDGFDEGYMKAVVDTAKKREAQWAKNSLKEGE